MQDLYPEQHTHRQISKTSQPSIPQKEFGPFYFWKNGHRIEEFVISLRWMRDFTHPYSNRILRPAKPMGMGGRNYRPYFRYLVIGRCSSVLRMTARVPRF
jgi:hypothetical protein